MPAFANRYRDLSSLDDPVLRFEMLWSDPGQIDRVPIELQYVVAHSLRADRSCEGKICLRRRLSLLVGEYHRHARLADVSREVE